MRYQLRDLISFSTRSLMLILTLMLGLTSSTAFAGPIILGGDDLDFHGNFNSGSGPNQKGWLYIQRALASMYRDGCITRPGNDGSIAVLGAPFSNVPNGTSTSGGRAGAAIHFAAVALTPPRTVTYYDLAAGINSFFAGLSAGTINPAVIYIPSSLAIDGINTAEGAALTANANAIKAFVNSGGGLMAHIDGANTSGWVTTVTGVTVNTVCNSTGATLTSAGNTAFPALSNSDIDMTAGPCHSTFSGTLGGLSVLALDGGGTGTAPRNLILGGDCGTVIVTPPQVSLCCPPWNSTALANSMFYQGSGAFTAPYTLKFQPASTLNTQMQAYVAYIHALYPTVTSLTETFSLRNAVSSGNTCAPTGAPIATATATWTWTSGTPTLAPLNFFTGFPMLVNNWYQISTVTTLNGTHPPLDGSCINTSMCFRVQVMPGVPPTPGHPGGPFATLQMRLPDGRMIERRNSMTLPLQRSVRRPK